jgi:hypothetical protein
MNPDNLDGGAKTAASLFTSVCEGRLVQVIVKLKDTSADWHERPDDSFSNASLRPLRLVDATFSIKQAIDYHENLLALSLPSTTVVFMRPLTEKEEICQKLNCGMTREQELVR